MFLLLKLMKICLTNNSSWAGNSGLNDAIYKKVCPVTTMWSPEMVPRWDPRSLAWCCIVLCYWCFSWPRMQAWLWHVTSWLTSPVSIRCLFLVWINHRLFHLLLVLFCHIDNMGTQPSALPCFLYAIPVFFNNAQLFPPMWYFHS